MPMYRYVGKLSWKPVGQTWVERGYVTTASVVTPPDDCPVCGIPQNLCTGETHKLMAKQQAVRQGMKRLTPHTEPQQPEQAVIPDQDGSDKAPDVNAGSPEQSDVSPSTTEQSQCFPGAPKDGRVLAFDEPLTFSGEPGNGFVTVTENVYRQRKVPRTKGFTYILVYPKGHRLPASVAQRIQEQAEQRQANQDDKPPADKVTNKE